jgi:hypothetical protein
MVNIKNEAAAREANELAHNFVETALQAFSRLPENPDLKDLLGALDLRLTPRREGIASGSFRVPGHPDETVVLVADHAAVSGPEHQKALQELTEIRTAVLRDDAGPLTAADIASRRRVVSAELIQRRDKLAKPMGLLSRMPGLSARVAARRHVQQDEQLAALQDVLSGQFLTGPIFDKVAASALSAAGLTADQLPELVDIKAQAIKLHTEFRDRHDMILMLIWEAITTEDGGADSSAILEDRLARFRAAKSKARQYEEDQRTFRQEQKAKADAAERETRRNKILLERQERQARLRSEAGSALAWAAYNEPQPEGDMSFGS